MAVWVLIGTVALAVPVVLFAGMHLFKVGGKLAETGRAAMENQQAFREIEQATREYAQREQSDLFSSAPPDAMMANFDQYVATMEAKTARLSGTDGVIGRATVKMLRLIQPHAKAYASAMQRTSATDGVDPTVINSLTDIANARSAFAALKTATQRLADVMQTVPGAFRTELEAGGISPDVISEAVRGFNQGMQFDAAQGVHAANIALCDVSIKLLDLLKREWGEWKFHKDLNAFEFESILAERQFEDLMHEMENALLQVSIHQP